MYADTHTFEDIEVGGTVLLNGRRFEVTSKTDSEIGLTLQEGETQRFESDSEVHPFHRTEVNERLPAADDPFNYA